MRKCKKEILYKWGQRITMLLFLCVLLGVNGYANKFELKKSESWIVFDASSKKFNAEWIQQSKAYNKIGFVLNLKFNQTENIFYHESGNGATIEFRSITASLIKNIVDNNNRYAIIFNVDKQYIGRLNSEIEHLVKQLPETSKADGFDNIHDILNSSNLLFFSTRKHSGFNKYVYNLYKYFEEHYISESVEKQIKSPTKAQASILYNLFNRELKNSQELDFTTIVDERHYWQNKYISHWTKTGLQPIFIVSNGVVEHINEFIEIAQTINYTGTCNGLVHVNGAPIDYVYWEAEESLYSRGYFNVPIFSKRILKPYRPGYLFSPKQIEVTEGIRNKEIVFSAEPIPITKNLKLNLTFNRKNILKSSNLHKPELIDCETVIDKERGKVLKINPFGYFRIGNTEDFNLKDNSFTISCWFKTNDTTLTNYEIFGTNTTIYREGLHLEIRGTSPYFGFFINDVQSSSTISYNNWHHLVYSYDRTSREKRIYINGELTDIALESPSFISSDSLFIGKCINLQSAHPFYLDNFTIWSRTLNENEVRNLQSDNSFLIALKQSKKQKLLTIALALLFLVLLVYFSSTFRFKKKKSTKLKIRDTQEPKRNAIYLFGNIAVFDKNKIDVIPNMSPLLKELFLKLLSAYIMGIDGVSNNELTELFWANLPSQKARNTRNVAFARLRKYIENVDGLSIEFAEGKHCVVLADELFVDYFEAIKNASLLNEHEIQLYYDVVKRGKFMQQTNYEWLEAKQGEVNEETSNILLNALELESVSTNNKFAEKICLHILSLDDLHEDALRYLLVLYKKQSKIAAMKNTFSDYMNTYKKVYGVSSKYSLNDFLKLSSFKP